MKPLPWLGAGAAAVTAIVVAMLARDGTRPLPARSGADRPALALLTSLPLAFGESFALDSPRPPVMGRLERRYRVETIAVADAASLRGRSLLLMAHPRAQPASALVELDAWVRGGGRVLLLADPRSDWPSELALGDNFRPQPAFADTGLLGHWGLRLEGPEPGGPRRLAGVEIETRSPGRLHATNPECSVEADGFAASCPVGKGRVTVIADSDFLDAEASAPGLHALDRALETLESR